MDRFESFRRHRAAVANVAGVVVPLGFTAVLVPFRSSVANTAAALVLVAIIVGVAVLGNRLAGFLSAASSALWFDFFLTRPYDRLAIAHRPDIETAVSLFLVGLVVSELAARSRHHHGVAVTESDHVDLIYRVSELVSSGAPTHEVIERVRVELIELLHLRACRYESGVSTRPSVRIEHEGYVLLAGNVWDVQHVGLPGPELELLVQGRGQTVGRFVLTPTPGFPVSLQRRVVAVTIADQVGAVLQPHLRSA